MRLLYLIGALGRGGAELQAAQLALAMSARGHEVRLLAYDGPSELDTRLVEAGVEVVATRARNRREKLHAVRESFGSFRPDVAHGVMKRASALAVLARGLRRRPAVLATDMSTATFKPNQLTLRASLLAFGLADLVVTQTELNRRSLERLAPWLRGKTQVIRNGLDTERFDLPSSVDATEPGPFRFCVAGTVYPVKNPDRVIRAVAELRDRGRTGFRVDWYGRLGQPGYEAESDRHPAVSLARQLGVDDLIRFQGDTVHIERAYQSSDALLHASVQEGFPNVVAEGMACGLPLVVSTVSDLPLVVCTARNGFVFDERDVGAIADAMARMMDMAPAERVAMGERSRELAVRWFGMDRFQQEFELLYQRLRDRV